MPTSACPAAVPMMPTMTPVMVPRASFSMRSPSGPPSLRAAVSRRRRKMRVAEDEEDEEGDQQQLQQVLREDGDGGERDLARRIQNLAQQPFQLPRDCRPDDASSR